MPHEALVIDDDPEVQEMVAEILDSLGHGYDMATCQEEARELLRGKRYTYCLVDLEIPVRAGKGLPRIQNGENLIAEIVQQRGTRKEPIIVITGHDKQNSALAVRMMKLGAADYVTKPFPPTGETLDKAIREALGSPRSATVAHNASSEPVRAEQPGRFAGGEMVFYASRVELCGAVILRGHGLMRRILDELRTRQANGKAVAIGGPALAKKLGLLRGQNAIAEAVKDFRNTVVDVLETSGIACGRQDVIQGGGPGYRLAEWIEVRDAQRAWGDGQRSGNKISG